jgi:benzoate/toluate 1,2-dioxygenase beta subunit
MTATMQTAITDSAVTAFLYQEARLADQAKYEEWFGLWAAGDIVYWVAPRADTDPKREVSLVYDNRDRLEQRVARWESGFAWVQDPRSKTNRIVGNVEVVELRANSVTARANVHICVSRRGRSEILVEHVTYRLDFNGTDYSIVEKKVVLLDEDAPVGNINFVL